MNELIRQIESDICNFVFKENYEIEINFKDKK